MSEVWTVATLRDAPPTLPLVPDVAGILGMGENKALELAARGKLPVPAWKHGLRWVVPTGHLMRHLGLPVPGDAEADGGHGGRGALDELLAGAYVVVSVAALREAVGVPATSPAPARPVPVRERSGGHAA